MALVDRAMLQEHASQMISQETNICDSDDCPCFKKVKEELKYSILSHRWGFPELAFSEYAKLNGMISEEMQEALTGTKLESSLAKLLEFRRVSAQNGCKYVWIDTICINKESSAELDESIRSMYAWYRDSHICIVHLSQTHYSLKMKTDTWFTRGWTLQELLAPKRIKFFSASWKEITSRENDKDLDNEERQAAKEGKDRPPLWSAIREITGISIDDLLDFKPGLYDIGKRMTWASKRKTTRVEDMAYCLIGIFCVNLSIAYGEKEGAFYRLQAEIMQNSDDQSLFDWQGDASAYNSMFAASPVCFSRAQGLSTANKPPVAGAIQPSMSVANFERRVSRVVYYKSKLPNLDRVWAEDPRATAFTLLGPSLKPGEYLLMVLQQPVDNHQHYKRLKVIKARVNPGKLPEESVREIIIK